MRKIYLLVFIAVLCVLFCACNSLGALDGRDSFDELSLTEGYEAYPQYSRYNSLFRCGEVGVLKSGMIEVEGDNRNYGIYIFYSPNGISNYIPLCARPDCMHDSSDCNAAIKSMDFGIWQNKIYYWLPGSSEFIICGIDINGFSHEEVVRFEWESDCSYAFQFDREYLYFDICYDNGEIRIGRIKLEKGAEPEIVALPGIEFLSTLVPVDSAVYINASFNGVRGFYKYSFKEKSIDLITDKWSCGQFYQEDKVYYLCHGDENREGLVEGFYEWDANTHETKLMREFDVRTEYASAIYTDEYIFVEEFGTDVDELYLYIFNRNYDLLSLVPHPLERSRQHSTMLTYTGKYLLLMGDGEKLYYIDKADFDTYPVLHEIEGD